jgi:hypothetical protein
MAWYADDYGGVCCILLQPVLPTSANNTVLQRSQSARVQLKPPIAPIKGPPLAKLLLAATDTRILHLHFSVITSTIYPRSILTWCSAQTTVDTPTVYTVTIAATSTHIHNTYLSLDRISDFEKTGNERNDHLSQTESFTTFTLGNLTEVGLEHQYQTKYWHPETGIDLLQRRTYTTRTRHRICSYDHYLGQSRDHHHRQC